MAAIQQRVKGILNIIFNKNEKGNDGTGFFVVQDVEAAENLVELEGEIICGRPIYFSVDEAEYLSMNPISTYQLGSVPKFYNSSLANKSENSELVKVEAPNLPNN